MDITYDTDRARQAVQFLAASSYFSKHVLKLRTALRRPRAMPYKGDNEFLNELVVIGRQSKQAFENLVHVAETKRDDRNDYQRQFMATKRRRDRKVIALEELRTGEMLRYDERLRVLTKQYGVWNAEKAAVLARYHDCSWAERNEHLRVFWEEKERELDEAIEAARLQPKQPMQTVYIVRSKETAIGQALSRAAQGRPILAGDKAVRVVDKATH